MKKYILKLREEVLYRVELELEDGQSLEEAVEMVIAEGEFHPIEDFLSVEERDPVELTDAEGNWIDLNKLHEYGASNHEESVYE